MGRFRSVLERAAGVAAPGAGVRQPPLPRGSAVRTPHAAGEPAPAPGHFAVAPAGCRSRSTGCRGPHTDRRRRPHADAGSPATGRSECRGPYRLRSEPGAGCPRPPGGRHLAPPDMPAPGRLRAAGRDGSLRR